MTEMVGVPREALASALKYLTPRKRPEDMTDDELRAEWEAAMHCDTAIRDLKYEERKRLEVIEAEEIKRRADRSVKEDSENG